MCMGVCVRLCGVCACVCGVCVCVRVCGVCACVCVCGVSMCVCVWCMSVPCTDLIQLRAVSEQVWACKYFDISPRPPRAVHSELLLLVGLFLGPCVSWEGGNSL